MNRNVKANRVSDPDDISGGLLHFFNRYYMVRSGEFLKQFPEALTAPAPHNQLKGFELVPGVIIKKTVEAKLGNTDVPEVEKFFL